MKPEQTPGFISPDILLPRPGTDLSRWAVIACDQFTSEPEYWDAVEKTVGDAPSTYHMILPEVFLDSPREQERIASTRRAMAEYLDRDMLVPHQGMIYVERSAEGRTRKGLMLCLDLEQYDYSKGSQTLIRATEGTVVERLPPRIRIREGAQLELPHILVLIDDPERTVIEPVGEQKQTLPCLYDTDLMLGSGHITGYSASDPRISTQVTNALMQLADPERFRLKYSVGPDKGVLLFAMGDGNHSLATAKSIWEVNKSHVDINHPSRYALVEIENVHDDGLVFEPIHRVLFDIRYDLENALMEFFGTATKIQPCQTQQEMVATVRAQTGPSQQVGYVSQGGYRIIECSKPTSQLAVGTLQPFLDKLLERGKASRIDYVHGDDVTCRLGNEPGNAGFILPNMAKADLFKTVIMDGVLPRKTFSMGHAKEKRFYMECRKIV